MLGRKTEAQYSLPISDTESFEKSEYSQKGEAMGDFQKQFMRILSRLDPRDPQPKFIPLQNHNHFAEFIELLIDLMFGDYIHFW